MFYVLNFRRFGGPVPLDLRSDFWSSVLKEKKISPAQIAKLRERLALNKLEFGRRLGVTRQSVSFWELGTHAPKGASLKVLKDLFEEMLPSSGQKVGTSKKVEKP
jgi:DNA-binding XRE family transcriptional regulator